MNGHSRLLRSAESRFKLVTREVWRSRERKRFRVKLHLLKGKCLLDSTDNETFAKEIKNFKKFGKNLIKKQNQGKKTQVYLNVFLFQFTSHEKLLTHYLASRPKIWDITPRTKVQLLEVLKFLRTSLRNM